MFSLKRFILGRRLASTEAKGVKVGNVVGLSIFSSDALSSVAYATQEILASISSSLGGLGVAVAAGAVLAPFYRLSLPVAIAIIILLVILGVSYKQTINAYPNGGSAYLVAKSNLGEMPSLIAGASLLVDFVLTVAVSASSGVANIASAITVLKGHEVFLTIAAIVLVALVNLRGTEDSGKLFAIPTYGFAILLVVLLGSGAVKVLMGHAPTPQMVETSVSTAASVSQFAILIIFLKAFSAGCTALTGVEGISNGVSAFREPRAQNASKVMTWMLIMLATMFMGVTLLANRFNLVYMHSSDPRVITETLLSMLAKAVYGDVETGFSRILYLATMGFTFLVLIVAANSSFAGFPRLAAMISRNRYLPKQFSTQGGRLVFSNGIIILAIVSSLLVWLLHANTDLLLPLYAMGVFIGFTISQASMVMHWRKWRDTEKKWLIKSAINGVGAMTTGVVLVVIIFNKFKSPDHLSGVWIIMLIIPALIWLFLKIHWHYDHIRASLASSRAEPIILYSKSHVIVLVNSIHRGTLEALRYAKAITGSGIVEALNIDFRDESGNPSLVRFALESEWQMYCSEANIPLRFIENRYRQVVEPIVNELDRMRKKEPETLFTVVVPEFVTESIMGNILHNQTALRIKTVLREMPNTVVVSVPYKIGGGHDRDPHIIGTA